ncbi:MAG TPA: hypothetical protein VHS57_03400 [Acidimicrobiales bacterium]|jgi:hypothetical protein|nr:hypothetical protein [Acidimicrobiales bacterium]
MREGPIGAGGGGFSVLPEELAGAGQRISALATDAERLAGEVIGALLSAAPAIGDGAAEGLCHQLTTDLTRSFGGLALLSQHFGAVTVASSGAYSGVDGRIAGAEGGAGAG